MGPDQVNAFPGHPLRFGIRLRDYLQADYRLTFAAMARGPAYMFVKHRKFSPRCMPCCTGGGDYMDKKKTVSHSVCTREVIGKWSYFVQI